MSDQLFSVENKICIVTGGLGQIGKNFVQELWKRGARVAVWGRTVNDERIAKTLGEEALKTSALRFYSVDITKKEEMNAALDDMEEVWGDAPDVLVNNAGITRDSLMLRMKEEDWDAVLDTNLKSAFNTVKALQRVLMKSPAGRIINMSSVIGLVGNIGQANYAASKAGLIGFTKSLAQEFAPRKVTCNAIAPGFISTEMSNAIPDNLKEEIVKKIPLKEQGSVEDIAALTAFLASDDARYITGQVIACDGGMTM